MTQTPKVIHTKARQIHVGSPTHIGALSNGPSLVHLSFVPNTGFIKSEPSYPIQLDAVFTHGADYIKVDATGKHARLEVQSTATSPQGALRYNYTGTADLSSPAGKVLRGDADAATTDFGGIFAQAKFETGVPELKELENKTFVGSGRFILEEGKGVVVEYKVSEVAN